jgi:hypothetical protein
LTIVVDVPLSCLGAHGSLPADPDGELSRAVAIRGLGSRAGDAR